MTIDEMARWMALSLLQHGQLSHREVIDRLMVYNPAMLRLTQRGYGLYRDLLEAFHERTGGREKWSRPHMLWTLAPLARGVYHSRQRPYDFDVAADIQRFVDRLPRLEMIEALAERPAAGVSDSSTS